QAEDGIRDFHVTGVQTCALPIYAGSGCGSVIDGRNHLDKAVLDTDFDAQATELPAGAFLQLGEGFRLKIGRVRVEIAQHALDGRSEERRVGTASRRRRGAWRRTT